MAWGVLTAGRRCGALTPVPDIKKTWEFYRSVAAETAGGLFLWMVLDLFFAVLPLLVLIVVGELFQVPAASNFWALPEWSFATIVLAAASLRDLLHLKVDLQKDERNRVLAAIMMVMAILVFSSLILGAIYSERGNAKISLSAVAEYQQFLFIMTIIVYVIIHWLKQVALARTRKDGLS